MRKKYLLIIGLAMILILSGSLWSRSDASDRFDPFFTDGVEKYLSSMWVGDRVILAQEYSFEILEGENLCRFIQGEGSVRNFTQLEFTGVGTVILNATRNEDNVSQEYEFTVSPPLEQYEERLLAESVKIGSGFKCFEICNYYNCLNIDSWPGYDIVDTNFNQYYFWNHPMGAGSGFCFTRENDVDIYARTSEGRIWLFGYATKPGVVYFDIDREEKGVKRYEMTVEEPVITTNIPTQVDVGETVQITTSLDNTDLENVLITEVKDAIVTNEYGITKAMLGYEPRIEIISGADLVERSNGDYSSILTASETMKFINDGIVVLKVVYEMIPIPEDSGELIGEVKAIYSPEKTFTIKVGEGITQAEEEEPEEDMSGGNASDEDEQDDTSSNPGSDETNTENAGTSEENDNDVQDFSNSAAPTTEELLQIIEEMQTNQDIKLIIADELIFDEEVLRASKDGNHELYIAYVDYATGDVLYEWNIKSIDNLIDEWNTNIIIGEENPEIEEILEEYEMDGEHKSVEFEHEGVLPGKAYVKIFVGDTFNIAQTVHFYYFNAEINILEIVGSYVVDEEGYVTVEIEHCSEYILTETKIPENEITAESNKSEGEEKNDDVQDGSDDEMRENAQKSSKKVAIIIVGIVLVTGGIVLITINRNKILENVRRK